MLISDTGRPLVLPIYLWTLYLLSMILFVALCIWAVYEFCHSILHTAKLISRFTDTKGLDEKQLAIIDLSSKYSSLFIISLCFTVIHFFVFSLFNYLELDSTMLLGVESIVNLLCLLFQYDFAEMYYYRYCNRMDVCCRWSITRRLGKHDEAVKAKRIMMHLRSGGTVDEMTLARELELDSYMTDGTRTQTNGSQDTELDSSRDPDFVTPELTMTSFNVGNKIAVPTFSSMNQVTTEEAVTGNPTNTDSSVVDFESQIAGSDLMGTSLKMVVEPSITAYT